MLLRVILSGLFYASSLRDLSSSRSFRFVPISIMLSFDVFEGTFRDTTACLLHSRVAIFSTSLLGIYINFTFASFIMTMAWLWPSAAAVQEDPAMGYDLDRLANQGSRLSSDAYVARDCAAVVTCRKNSAMASRLAIARCPIHEPADKWPYLSCKVTARHWAPRSFPSIVDLPCAAITARGGGGAGGGG